MFIAYRDVGIAGNILKHESGEVSETRSVTTVVKFCVRGYAQMPTIWGLYFV
jgi:hypothetical protein